MKKESHWPLSFLFPLLSRAVGSYSNSGCKIVALQCMRPPWLLHPPPKHNRNNIFCICDLWPLSWFSRCPLLWAKEHIVSLASKRYWVRWSNSIEVEAIPSLSSISKPLLLCLPLSWLHTCRRHHRYRLACVKCWKGQTAWTPVDPWLSRFSQCLEKKLVWEKKHRGVHRERHESLFFTANFKENFSTVCMMDFLKKKWCTYGDKPKCTVP